MSFSAWRDKYGAWASAEFGAAALQGLDFDELAFPHFAEVEREFAAAVEAGTIRTAAASELEALLYLIARSWDAGRLIAWISTGPQLSNVADLSADDALVLATAALTAPGKAFDDARTQFATILPRVSITNPKVSELLLGYFNADDMYTRRIALTSLAKIKHPKTRECLRRLWTEGDEWARITCLSTIEEHLEDDALLDNYLALAKALPGEHLAQNREEAEQRRSLRP